MVLVVDDHADTCRVLMLLLRRSGMQAACVTSGREALSAVPELRPGCMVLDDDMPDLTGLDVLRAIRTELKLTALTVIVYSAAEDSRRKEEARRLGAVDWIVKAGHPERLIKRVAEVCELGPQ